MSLDARDKPGHDEFRHRYRFHWLHFESGSRDGAACAYPGTTAPLTKRQQNQPLMVNALLSVVVYFLLVWHRVTVSSQVA